MKTKICPTCGCSLIRLGINEHQAESASLESVQYYFCCNGCKDQFLQNPEPYIEEWLDLHVCPVCFAEKPSANTVPLVHNKDEIRLCRCTHCREVFEKDPAYYLNRLDGKIEFTGLFSGQKITCCH